jgi:hypothetical protein
LPGRQPANHRFCCGGGGFGGGVKAAAQGPIAFPVLDDERFAGVGVGAAGA